MDRGNVMEKIKLHYTVDDSDFSNMGFVSGDVQEKLKSKGFSQEVVRKVSTALYQGEINMLIHAGGGKIEIIIDDKCIIMILKDNGPGIEDIDKALEEKIGRKLNRNLPYLFRTALVLFPDVLQVFSCYQHQIIITYHFGRVSYNPPYSGSLFGEVQFKLGVVVYRISEFRFITFRNVKAILI